MKNSTLAKFDLPYASKVSSHKKILYKLVLINSNSFQFRLYDITISCVKFDSLLTLTIKQNNVDFHSNQNFLRIYNFNL